MIVPPDQIDSETLENLLQEFVTREGTDYGANELSLKQKVDRLRPQIFRGEVLIIFDEFSQTINLMPAQDVPSDLR